jgi:hypothetical protein
MAHLLRRGPLLRICAVAGSGNKGYTDFRQPHTDWLDPAVPLSRHGRRWLWDHITIALAGTRTQRAGYPDTPESSGLPDLRKAWATALRACENDVDRANDYANRAASRVDAYLVQLRYQVLVSALADALMDAGTLTGRQARDLLKATEIGLQQSS